ncbi:MAG TPA: FkbM family methyltransferase [Bacilli bacterium]|nr:FkbM family methyltransferase [Bacilli bacterium]
MPDLPSFLWQFKEIFVDEIYNFEPKTNKPLIYDCGANIGISVLYFKQLFPKAKIKAFEADQIIVDILKNNLLKNGINDVEIINKAVWINNNGVEFGSDGADGGSVILSNNKTQIESIRLKDLLEKEEKIDLLKIDVEGAEYDVLLDCKDNLDNIDNLFVEYHSWNNTSQKLSKILEVLEENKFRYYIESVSKRKKPFINKDRDKNMDLQLNIFAYNQKKNKYGKKKNN